MRVFIIGNCQAGVLASMLRETYPDWTVDEWTIFLPEAKRQVDSYRRLIAAADVILSQPIHDYYDGIEEFGTSWVRANKRNSTDLVIIPNLFFRGQHPGQLFFGWDGRPFQAFGQPYQDVLALHYLFTTESRSQAYELVMQPDGGISEMALQTIASRSLDDLRRREEIDLIDVTMSDFIADYWREVGLFHTVNHPARVIVAEQLNRFLRRMGKQKRVAPSGVDHFELIHFPATPRLQTELAWNIRHAELIRVPDGIFLRDHYYKAYLSFVDHLQTPSLREAMYTHDSTRVFLLDVLDGRPFEAATLTAAPLEAPPTLADSDDRDFSGHAQAG